MRLLSDENFNNRILRGLQEKLPDIDVLRVQDTEIYRANDPAVLEWAAKENRVLLTHDVHTMINYAYERVKLGLPMPGVIEVHEATPVGQAIDELLIILGAGVPADFENQVLYIPMS